MMTKEDKLEVIRNVKLQNAVFINNDNIIDADGNIYTLEVIYEELINNGIYIKKLDSLYIGDYLVCGVKDDMNNIRIFNTANNKYVTLSGMSDYCLNDKYVAYNKNDIIYIQEFNSGSEKVLGVNFNILSFNFIRDLVILKTDNGYRAYNPVTNSDIGLINAAYGQDPIENKLYGIYSKHMEDKDLNVECIYIHPNTTNIH